MGQRRGYLGVKEIEAAGAEERRLQEAKLGKKRKAEEKRLQAAKLRKNKKTGSKKPKKGKDGDTEAIGAEEKRVQARKNSKKKNYWINGTKKRKKRRRA